MKSLLAEQAAEPSARSIAAAGRLEDNAVRIYCARLVAGATFKLEKDEADYCCTLARMIRTVVERDELEAANA